MSCLTLCRGGIRRQVAHAKAAQVSTDPLCIDDRSIPRAVINHRTFDRELASVAVENRKNELPTGHRMCSKSSLIAQTARELSYLQPSSFVNRKNGLKCFNFGSRRVDFVTLRRMAGL